MAALSAVQTATTLTPPSSSHGDGNGFSWDFASAKHEVSSLPPLPSRWRPEISTLSVGEGFTH